MSVQNKKILLIIAGGIAAYKVLELIRLIKKSGGTITAIMTKSAKEFITPLSVAILSKSKVYEKLFNLIDETKIGHINLSKKNDLTLVIPATANILAKLAHGIADDLATTLLLTTNSPIMVFPTMNARMWENPSTQNNMIILRKNKIIIINPVKGDMACGEFGYGRLFEPKDILSILNIFFKPNKQVLIRKKILITAGSTHEPIDPIRFLGNISSGKQGYALATAAFEAGASVTLITGPSNEPIPTGINVIKVITAEQMLNAVKLELPVDIAIFTAAVVDWKIKNYSNKKIKKESNNITKVLTFTENPDILKIISNLNNNRPKLVIGFAAETDNIFENAKIKIKNKGCDLIIVNDINPQTGILGGYHNKISIIKKNNKKIEHWDFESKIKIAKKLIQYIGNIIYE